MTIIGATPRPSGPAEATAASAGDILDGSDHSFQTDVLQESLQRPVIVDFWAPWCGPCKTLQPALEQAVAKAGGKVRLVKINIDENPHIAGQLRVQSIPAVFAFDQGRPVDGFAGALPASEVARFVERLAAGGPAAQAVADALAAAAAALEAGDVGTAIQTYAQVLQAEPENAAALAGVARCYLANGDVERARDVLASASADAQKDPAFQSAQAALELAASASETGEVADLRARLAAAPHDHHVRFDLARALASQGDLKSASEHLLEIVAADRDWNDGAARAEALKIFEAAGPTSPVTVEGRRRLSTILFA